MFDFYQKRKLKTVITSRYTQAIILVLTCLVAWSAFVRFQIATEMAERRERLETERTELEIHKNVMQDRVDYLSDERGIEAEMRRQFDVAKEGEQVVVIVEPVAEPEVLPLASTTKVDKAWYQFWR
jgi:hypothetical protein